MSVLYIGSWCLKVNTMNFKLLSRELPEGSNQMKYV